MDYETTEDSRYDQQGQIKHLCLERRYPHESLSPQIELKTSAAGFKQLIFILCYHCVPVLVAFP